MKELTNIKCKILFFFAVAILFNSSCQLFQPTAYFFISNVSEDRATIDMKVTIGEADVINDSIKYSNIRPDLQYTPSIDLPKGKYLITVAADSGRLQQNHPIMLDVDKFIFVSYSYSAPIDSTRLKENPLLIHSNKFNGVKPSIKIYITDKEPVHM